MRSDRSERPQSTDIRGRSGYGLQAGQQNSSRSLGRSREWNQIGKRSNGLALGRLSGVPDWRIADESGVSGKRPQAAAWCSFGTEYIDRFASTSGISKPET